MSFYTTGIIKLTKGSKTVLFFVFKVLEVKFELLKIILIIMKQFKLFFLFILFCTTFSKAQLLESNPSIVKWSKINTNHFKFIYPKGLDSIAKSTVSYLEKSYVPVSQSFGPNPRPITIILQNQNTVSNGFVTLSPRRSEFYITPPQDYVLLGNNNWLDLLATHEFRHVAQLDKVLKSKSKVTQLLFGSNGQDLVNSISMPNWLLEGDAVGTETAFSPGGRGRIPQFNQAFRAQIMEFPKKLTYSQITAGSYNHFMPNHYVYGYSITNYMKEKYGYNVWDKITQKQFVFPFIPFGFSNSVRKFSNKSIDQVFGGLVMDYRKDIEKELVGTVNYEKNLVKTEPVKRFTEYSYPQPLKNGSIIAIKYGYDHIPQIVEIANGKEKKLFELGPWNDANMFSANDSVAVWAEFESDLRWGKRDFSVIKLLDLKTKKVRRLMEKTRWTAPSISPNGQEIALIETDEKGKNSLLIVDITTGYILKNFTTLQNTFYLHPSWSQDGKSVVVVEQDGSEKAIVMFDLDTKTKKVLLAASKYNNLAYPKLYENTLYFNNASNGKEYVMQLDLTSNEVKLVSNGKYGSYYASVSPENGNLVFNNFTSKGNVIVSLSKDQYANIPVKIGVSDQPIYFGKWMMDEAKNAGLIKSEEPKISAPSNYSRWNILNVYNWGPVFNSDYGTGFRLGVISQDKLSTAAIEGGFSYDFNEQKFNKYASIVYEGFYPTLSLNWENNNRVTKLPKEAVKPGSSLQDSWKENVLNFSVGLPIKIKNSKYTTIISPKIGFQFNKGEGYDLSGRYLTEVANTEFLSNKISLLVNSGIKTAKRDVDNRWGQTVYFYNTKAVSSAKVGSNVLGLSTVFKFPFILPHDRLQIGLSYAENLTNQDLDNKKQLYIYGSQLPQTRGYETNIFRESRKISLDYKFILSDVNLSLARMAHFQRFMLNAFADKSFVNFKNDKNILQKRELNSVGLDFIAVTNFMRLPFPFEIGVRAVYAPEQISDKKFQVFPLILSLGF